MRIGLAGAGRIGRLHAQILPALDDVDAVLVADPVPGAAHRVAEAAGVEAAGADAADVEAAESVDRLFDSGLDAVVVAAATDAHADLVVRAAKAGLPVFVEKPVAVDVDGTLDVMNALAGSGVPVQVGFQRRFDPAYVEARRSVIAGDLGWVHTLRSCTLDPAPPTADYVASSGGLFRDCAVHDFDSIRWVTGREIVSVSALGANRGADFFTAYDDVDTAAAMLMLDDDSVALVSCTRYNAAGYDVRLEVLGERGSLAVGLDDHTPLRSTEPGMGFPRGPAYTGFQQRFAAAYRAELDTFVHTVARDGEASPCTPADALEAFYVAEAAELARRQQRTVTLEEVRR